MIEMLAIKKIEEIWEHFALENWFILRISQHPTTKSVCDSVPQWRISV